MDKSNSVLDDKIDELKKYKEEIVSKYIKILFNKYFSFFVR